MQNNCTFIVVNNEAVSGFFFLTFRLLVPSIWFYRMTIFCDFTKFIISPRARMCILSDLL